jgi:hypothetical protein
MIHREKTLKVLNEAHRDTRLQLPVSQTAHELKGAGKNMGQ